MQSVYALSMAASMVRPYAQFSLFKQLIVDTTRRNQLTSHTLQTFGATCVQCQCYHVTPVYLRHRKSRVGKKSVQELKAEAFLKANSKKDLPTISAWHNITVKELANSAKRNVDDILEALTFTDSTRRYTSNAVISDVKVVQAVVKALGAKLITITDPAKEKQDEKKTVSDVVRRPPPNESVLVRRHPVVTIMGHVDHGKTTLLDALRNTSVVNTEFGGITQHIGAFNVTLKSGERVTFLDTPGHAAFSAMRERGANATDIVVLVVAADDGVMEQTVQSIEMAREAKVPIIVAINKIDRPDADIERTKNMLAQRGIQVEDLGGDIQSVNISALKKINLETLTEAVVVQAELMNLRGDPNGLVEGLVIECSSHPGRGKLATVLIQRGTLKKGAVLVSGVAWAKVRSMFDHAGNLVKEARLSEAVQIIGWRALPTVGDEILEVSSEKEAAAIIELRESKQAESLAVEHQKEASKKLKEHLAVYKTELEQRRLGVRRTKAYYHVKHTEQPSDGIPRVNLIIKGDVAGSVEAILDVIGTYDDDQKCHLDVVHYGVGSVSESDIELAETFDAIIYQFNVDLPGKVKELLDKKNILARRYNVIYTLIDDVKEVINSKLPYVTVEEFIGEANVLQQFEITEGKKKVKVAGCRCTKGLLKKSALFHVIRHGETIHTGKLLSMKRLKEEVGTIKVDVECGLRLDDPTVSFLPGDVLVCFNNVRKVDTVNWDPGF